MSMTKEKWDREVHYCEEVARTGCLREFNYDWEIFRRYLAMLRRCAYREGFPRTSDRLRGILIQIGEKE